MRIRNTAYCTGSLVNFSAFLPFTRFSKIVHSLVAILCYMIQITCTEPEDQRFYFMVWKPFRPFCPSRGNENIFSSVHDFLTFYSHAFFLPLFSLLFRLFTLIFSVFVPRFIYSFFLLPWNADIYFSRRYQYPFTFTVYFICLCIYLPFYFQSSSYL